MRDGEAHIRDAIASLEAQTDPDFEVVAVDDGSTDGTAGLLAEWGARDPRVRIVSQPPGGIVRALERGRALARGVFLARMDADDVCDPRRFEVQRALLAADPRLGGCGARIRYFPRRHLRGGARRYVAWLNAACTPDEVERELFVECPLAHPAFFLRASVVASVGGYRDRGWPEDYDLLLRLWRAGHALANAPEVLVRWREGERRLSRTHPRYRREAFMACKVHHLQRSLLRDHRGAVLWGAGPVGKAFSRVLRRAGTPLIAFAEVDPRKIGQEIHGVPVMDTPGALALDGVLHLAAVGKPGGRAALREVFRAAGVGELKGFVAVA